MTLRCFMMGYAYFLRDIEKGLEGEMPRILAMIQNFDVKRIMTHDKGFNGRGLEIIDPV